MNEETFWANHDEALASQRKLVASAITAWSKGYRLRALVPRDIHTGPVALLLVHHHGIKLVDKPQEKTWAWADPHREMAYQWWNPVSNYHTKNPPPPPEWLLALGYSMSQLCMIEQAFDLAHPFSDKHPANYYEPRFDPDVTVKRLLAVTDALAQLLHLPAEDQLLAGQQIALLTT